MKFFIRKLYLWVSSEPPMNTEQADSFLTYLIIGVILGGRLGYVIFYNLKYYLEHPFEVLRVWDGGMAFHGGFLGVILAVILYCRFNRILLWSAADLVALASPPGLFFGRVANFINAELWGRPTDMPWGVVFPGVRAQQCEGIEIGLCARHPSQLYEAGLEGVLLFLILTLAALSGALKRPGLVTGIFSIGYGFSRFFVEYFRVPDPQFFSENNTYGYAFMIDKYGITMGQVLCLPMIFVGMLLIILSFIQAKKTI